MAKVCELCGKSTMHGHNIQHKAKGKWRYKAPRSNRTFKPNLVKVTLVNKDGKRVKITICTKCYKRLRKDKEDAEAGD